jgi:plastocyanin domain-containing protein
MKKIIALVVSGAVLVGAIIFFVASGRGDSITQGNGADVGSAEAVTTENGVQYINITAKGGYTPRTVTAKAGTKTIIRMRSAGAFDCSSTVVIPSIGFQKSLQPNEVAEIAIPMEKTQGKLQGICGMGMYNFVVNFQ